MIARIPSVEERDRMARSHRYAVAAFTKAGKETEVGSASSLEHAKDLADRQAARYRSVAVYDVSRGELVYSPRMAANSSDQWIVVRGGARLSALAAGPFGVREAQQEAKRLTRETGVEHSIRPARAERPGQLPDLPVPKGAERAYERQLALAWHYLMYRELPRTKRQLEAELDADEDLDPLWASALLEQYSRIKAGATSATPSPRPRPRRARPRPKLKLVRNRRRA
jgi:hypothetical protein